MTTYPIHTIESAPEGSRKSLHDLRNAFGLVPNLAATMANSPVLLNSFVAASVQFGGGSFTAGQRQVLLLTNAVANSCSWAVAFHSVLAIKEGIAPDEVQAIRQRRLPSDPRLAALSAVTRQLIDKRGHLEESEVKAFLGAGFEEIQLLEVLAGLACSTMANFTGNIAQPPVDPPFRAQIWDQ